MQSRNIGRKKSYLGEILSMKAKSCVRMMSTYAIGKPLGIILTEWYPVGGAKKGKEGR